MQIELRTVSDAANAVRGRRIELGLSQAALAKLVGVSRKWVYEFEAGKPRAELRLVLAVFDAVGLALSTSMIDASRRADGTEIEDFLNNYDRS